MVAELYPSFFALTITAKRYVLSLKVKKNLGVFENLFCQVFTKNFINFLLN